MIILLPGYVCLGMLTLINAVYISRGNIRYLFWGDLGGLVLLLLLDLWLVPDGVPIPLRPSVHPVILLSFICLQD